MEKEDPAKKIVRLMKESSPQSSSTDRSESELQEAFFKRTGIDCGPFERAALEELMNYGFSYQALALAKKVQVLKWDDDLKKHYVSIGWKEWVVFVQLAVIFVGLFAFVAIGIYYDSFGSGSLKQFVYLTTPIVVLAALGIWAKRQLWQPVVTGLKIKGVLQVAEGHN